MLNQIRPALVITIGLTLLTGLVYPLAITAVSAVVFPHQAGGSLVRHDGHVIGSSLIAQGFSKPEYFHPRPSATTAPDPKDPSKTVPAPYNAANSGGSNYGPTSKPMLDRIKGDVARLHKENPGAAIPIDLVTTSGSGLDPDITVEAALFQVPRVASARKLSPNVVAALVTQHVQGRTFGLFGEPHINVLDLNLALDALPKS